MRILDHDQVEVIGTDNGVVRTVHINFYEAHKDTLIPLDEYYTVDEMGVISVNKERVENSKKTRLVGLKEVDIPVIEVVASSPEEPVEKPTPKAKPKATTKGK